MSQRALAAVGLAFLLAAALPAVLALAPPAPSAPSVVGLVHLTPRELASTAPDLEVLEAYESFVLVRATSERFARLAAKGISVESMDAAQWIGLESFQFDIRGGGPAIPGDMRLAESDARGLYIVHFLGPVKAAWLDALRASGARVLHSIPNNAFLVSMDGAARDSVRAARFVDWVGPYHPAYRIHPDLAAASGLQVVQVLTVDSSDTEDVVAALKAAGLPRVPRLSPDPGVLATFAAGELGIVRARLDASLIRDLARLPDVLYVEQWREMRLEISNAQALLQTGLPPTNANARRLWDVGVRGAGEIVTAGDTGIDFDHNMFREDAGTIQRGQGGDPTGTIGPLSIYNTTDPTRRKLVRYIPMSAFTGVDPWFGGDPEAHKDSVNAGLCPSGHGTSVSGNAAGWDGGISTSPYDGMAPDAKLIMQDIGAVGPTMQCPGGGDILVYIPDDYDELFGPAYDNGSRIHTNSWGSSGNDYDVQAMMVDRFVWNHPDMAIFFAVGNDGPSLFSVGSPGTSKSALTIGGANPYPGQEILTGSSSRGPTADGRLKPDVITFFSGTDPSSSGNPTDNSNTAATRSFAGTSHSTPLAAGMAALVRQYFREGWYPSGTAVPENGFNASAALVKAAMAAGSRKMTDSSANEQNTYPNNGQGWGRLVLDDALYATPASEGPRKLWAVDRTNGLSTGQSVDYAVNVLGGGTPLRIVVAWSDYPAFPNANPALVNNLNLQVTSPTGAVYKGNVFGTFAVGESVPDSGSFDTRNPIEGVIVNVPVPGEWTIRLEAASVPSGPQGYGVVAAGDLDLGYGDIRLDKSVYSEADTIRIEVHDSNAAGVSVLVKSTIETSGEAVGLAETAPGSTVWRGAIATAFGDPATDGVLQVSEGGMIEATYSDLVPVHDATATATVDASAPAISNVRAEDITNAGATLRWTTNEPANSRAYLGTDPASLGPGGFDSGLVVSHGLPVVRLQTDTLYYFDVESADGLGHTTRDTNGGAHYTFRTTGQGEVLVVIADSSFLSDRLAMYRDALQRSAWPFSEWDVGLSGDPPLATLQQYKVVIWQTGLEQYPPLTDLQRTLVKGYLDGGGRLFLSSHDIAWAFCATTGNPYYTPARCTWLRSVLKTVWQQDPPSWTRNTGIAGEPISGPYTAGVNYVGHRDGGHGDEINNLCGGTGDGSTCTFGGAFASYVWRDNDPSGTDHIAIKWNSTGDNGTAGIGVWGGRPSKAVAFYFEFTGVNFVSGVASNPSRTDILNRTVVWLLDNRDHPAVRVRSPNGGETFTTSPVSIQWIRSVSGALAQVQSQTLYYSNNSGQSWNLIGTTPSPGDTSFSWDISALPNGARYRVRVVVQDDGNPALRGADASDTDFSIARAGGDAQGPLIWPGSVSIVPNPIVSGSLVTFRATADDSNRGNSIVSRVELFNGSTEPTPVAYGTGRAMTPSDGTFDEPLEDAAWVAAAPWPTGTDCFWVHAQDAAGNWGPFESRCTTITSTAGVDTVPPMEASFSSAVLAGGFADVTVTWSRAPDELGIGGTVMYRILRATALAGPYTQVSGDIPAGAPTYSYTDPGAGDGAPSPQYFYLIRTVDLGGNTANSTSRAGKFSANLLAGLSLVSSPFLRSDDFFSTLVQTAPPAEAWTYDGCTQSWLTYKASRPAGQNNLRTVGPGQAVYLELAAPDRLTVAGVIPGTTRITLCEGWTLVGFPSFAAITVSQVIIATGADAVLDFDAAAPPGYSRRMTSSEALVPGRGYWITVSFPTAWNVPGR